MNLDQITYYDMGFVWGVYNATLAARMRGASQQPTEDDLAHVNRVTAAAWKTMVDGLAAKGQGATRPTLPAEWWVEAGLLTPEQATVLAAQVEVDVARGQRPEVPSKRDHWRIQIDGGCDQDGMWLARFSLCQDNFPKSEVDEIVIGKWFHLELMDRNSYWMNVAGWRLGVRIYADGQACAICEWDGPGPEPVEMRKPGGKRK